MALNSYMTVKAQKQGQINGSVLQKGREGTMMIIAMSYAVLSPRDAASGLPTGKRMHKPLRVVKEIDKASPLLFNSLVTNENLVEVVIKGYTSTYQDRTQSTGLEMNHWQIKLTNAAFASYEIQTPNNKHPDLMKFETYEDWSMVFEKIEITWVQGGITGSDNWADIAQS